MRRSVLRGGACVAGAGVADQRWLGRGAPVRGGAPAAWTLGGSQVEPLHLLLDSDASDERDRIGRFLPWLATIGSVRPLIGLLGTVLGVMAVGVLRNGLNLLALPSSLQVASVGFLVIVALFLDGLRSRS